LAPYSRASLDRARAARPDLHPVAAMLKALGTGRSATSPEARLADAEDRIARWRGVRGGELALEKAVADHADAQRQVEAGRIPDDHRRDPRPVEGRAA
jgi:hypothetical protein